MIDHYNTPTIEYSWRRIGCVPHLPNVAHYFATGAFSDSSLSLIHRKSFQVLDESGVGNLYTLCHGDAKPNNFMFRKISLDFGDDEDFQDLDCEGVEAMLIDWQGGFLGSLCNDLMWCVFPFLEVNGHDADMYEFAIKHYYDELKNVLETFNCTLEDYGFPDTLSEFRSLIRRGFVLEFLIVTSLRPVLNITR